MPLGGYRGAEAATEASNIMMSCINRDWGKPGQEGQLTP